MPGKRLASRGSTDGFAMRFRSLDGEIVWATSFGGALGDSVGATAVAPDGAIWFAGRSAGTAIIGEATLHSRSGSMDGYVAQVSGDGDIRVVARLYGPFHSEHVSNLVHTDVGTYLVGYFSRAMWIGGIKLAPLSGSFGNGFVALADRAGKVLWAKTIPWIVSAGAAAAVASEGGLWVLSNGGRSRGYDEPVEMLLSHLSPDGERSFSVRVEKGSPKAVAQYGSTIAYGWVSHASGRREFHLSLATLE
jgi:hypothetical protein